ncbi:putative Late nodulin [Medicago truncatula]|uniref:Nodule Cysteine-Rich (NCR) secreted peptide n=1 Tax=Medicago truncatula TaxID=3880 RepID=A0A072UAP3_MEDTR|nr:Nodule Cysteine-Rich (NCR) secreted peptide [Medicago truncatula]RHN52004.1 putative Late nodulin [Medicago truncatula]
MAQFLLFVYFIIIIVSLFLVEAREPTKIPCVSDSDCHKVKKPLLLTCIDGICQYTLEATPFD